MKPFYCPDLGEGLQQATILKWLKKPGDTVEEDEPIVTLETDKTIIDIPANQSGILASWGGNEGDIIQKDSLLFAFQDSKMKGKLVKNQPEAAKIATKKTQAAKTTPQRAMPKARALAKQHGISLTHITPAQGDCILPSDVENHLNKQSEKTKPKPQKQTPQPAIDALKQAQQEAVVCTLYEDANISAWSKGESPTLRLLYAMAHAAKQYPKANAHFDATTQTTRPLNDVHIYLAMQRHDRLSMPTLTHVDKQTPESLRDTINALKHQNQTQQAAQAPSGLLLSNIGSYGGRYASALVMSPAIITLVAGKTRPGICQKASGQPCFGTVIPLSLNFDHRALSGAQAAQFLEACIRHLALQTIDTLISSET